MREDTTQWRKGGLRIDSVDLRPAKPIIAEIDAVVAEHYGFTDLPAPRLRQAGEELDFIIDCDINCRLGLSADEAGADSDEGERGSRR